MASEPAPRGHSPDHTCKTLPFQPLCQDLPGIHPALSPGPREVLSTLSPKSIEGVNE